MTEQDEYELRWWRESFALKFGPDGNLPKVGTPLYGRRLKIIDVSLNDGESES